MMKMMAKQLSRRKPARNADGGVHAKKSLGQNFLMHQAIADRIADAAMLSKKDTVLEIGPGTGMLTRALLERAGNVIAVEADAELIPKLAETFKTEIEQKYLELIHADIRTFGTTLLPKGYVLVANIPYYLTGEIFRDFLTAENKPDRLVLLVQKEVAVRIARSKKESLLSLSVKAYGTPAIEFNVPRGAFVPAPNVDSAVLSVRGISGGNFKDTAEESRFFAVLHAGFGHKRKKLLRNLEILAPKAAIWAAFQTIGLGENTRAEDLALSDWLKLTQTLS